MGDVTGSGSRRLLKSRPTSRYSVENDNSLLDVYRHFTTRGHHGRVHCLDASDDTDYILSGGADYTMRVWQYDEEYDSYRLQAVLFHTKPPGADEGDAAPKGLISRLFPVALKDVELIRRGVTAVAHVSSIRGIFSVGEAVEIEKDVDYVKEQFDYYDFAWDEQIEAMLGETVQVAEVTSQEVVGVPSPTEEGSVIRLPVKCVSRMVALPNRNGPFISGTSHGDVYVMCIHSNGGTGKVESFNKLHTATINEVVAVPTGGEQIDFLVATASDDGEAALLKLQCSEVTPRATPFTEAQTEEQDAGAEDESAATSMPVLILTSVAPFMLDDKPLRLRHTSDDGEPVPVLSVKHVMANEDPGRASLATLTKDGVHLWNLRGELLMILTVQTKIYYWSRSKLDYMLIDPKIQRYSHLAMAIKDNGTLLFVSGDDYTSVWAVDDGMVELPNFKTLDRNERATAWNEACRKFKEDGSCPKPTATYKRGGALLDVDQSGSMTRFAAERPSDYRCMLWSLLAIKPEVLAVEPPGAANLLIMPGRDNILMTLRHSSAIRALKVIEDTSDAGGPAVLVACENGHVFAWDVEGDNAQQIYAQMRSLSLVEILLPPALMVVSTIQIMSFAFGPTVPWRHEVKTTAVVVHNFAMLDFKASISVSTTALFWTEISGTLSLMVTFVLFAVIGFAQHVNTAISAVQDTECLQAERSKLGPAHMVLHAMRFGRRVVLLLLQLCSTIFVVPMFKSVAQAVDCEDGYLQDAPEVACGVFPQLFVKRLCWVIVPLYFLVLIPYSAVEGDASYVPRATLYDFKFWKEENMWRQASRRKATDVHLGILHPVPEKAFRTRFAELLAKTSLPFITLLLTEHPVTQMSLASLVGCWIYFHSMLHPPFIEAKFLTLVRHLKLLTMISMLLGLVTTVLAKFGFTESVLPIVFLAISVILTIAHLVYTLCRTPFRQATVLQMSVGGPPGDEPEDTERLLQEP